MLQAKALGVTPGPAYGLLQRGQAVTTAAGRVVQPAEVMEPATPGPLALVLDCPSASYLPALLRDATLRRCQAIGPFLGPYAETYSLALVGDYPLSNHLPVLLQNAALRCCQEVLSVSGV